MAKHAAGTLRRSRAASTREATLPASSRDRGDGHDETFVTSPFAGLRADRDPLESDRSLVSGGAEEREQDCKLDESGASHDPVGRELEGRSNLSRMRRPTTEPTTQTVTNAAPTNAVTRMRPDRPRS